MNVEAMDNETLEAAAMAQEDPEAESEMEMEMAGAKEPETIDWPDSVSQVAGSVLYNVTKAPSLSYERKIRLHKYAENRARSCLGLLSEASNMLWKLQDTKGDVAVFKPSSDWSEFISAKAVVRANASFPNVLKTIYDLKTSEKFKQFLHKVLGDVFLDAEVLEDLNGTGIYPSANPEREAREIYKQAAIKWWAIKSGNLATKSSDFYVLESIGIEASADNNDIKSCFLFQESLAEVGGMPQIQGNNLERSQFDALICKFEQLPTDEYEQEYVMVSVAFQRPPPLVSLFRSNPAAEMVLQLARGLRGLLEDPPEPQEISVVKTSAWVKDHDRVNCVICNRKFSSVFRRRHHCRTCGEVICWQCSSTIRVPSISFTHNDTGKQVLSRHQSSIRVCTRCVVSQQRNKTARSLSNQEEFREWIQRTKSEELENQLTQRSRHSPSDVSEDVQLIEDNQAQEKRFSRSLGDQYLQRRNSTSIDEEEKSESKLLRQKSYSSDGDNNEEVVHRHNTMRDALRRSSRQRTPAEQMEIDLSLRDSKRTGRSHRESSQMRGRRSRTPRNRGSKTPPPIPGRLSKSTPSRPLRSELPKRHLMRDVNQIRSDSTSDHEEVMKYNIDRRSSVDEKLTQQPTLSSVHAASVWATSRTETQATTLAFQELISKLGGNVHFLVVGFSTGFDADVIVGLMRQLAPGVPYIGGTIARGMCDENAWVSVNRHNDEGLITMWGVNDPDGIYSVVHAEYSQSDAREKTYAAAKMALARRETGSETEQEPAFVAVYACPLFVESAIDGIREAVSAPIVGGCSSDAAKQRDGNDMAVSWIQISSGNSSDYTRVAADGRGDWTEMGVAFALCYPSVETSVAWFSGYSPMDADGEYCMGTVTKASNKMIYEIDCKPAAVVYQEWLDIMSEHHQTELSSVGFPRLGNLHPLGTTIELLSNQIDSNGKKSLDATNGSSEDLSLQASDWSRLINMTAVITGFNDDGSLSTTSSIAPGTNVVLMETSSQSLKTAINKMGMQAMSTNKFFVSEVVGCLMFLSAGVQALLGHKSMAEMVGAYRDWSGGACLMGMTTFGEIGHLPHSTDFPHYDSLMFGAIIFSKRKRRLPPYY